MRAEQTELVRRAAARAKEHNRELKLASLEHQQRTNIEELRSKILRKVSFQSIYYLAKVVDPIPMLTFWTSIQPVRVACPFFVQG